MDPVKIREIIKDERLIEEFVPSYYFARGRREMNFQNNEQSIHTLPINPTPSDEYMSNDVLTLPGISDQVSSAPEKFV